MFPLPFALDSSIRRGTRATSPAGTRRFALDIDPGIGPNLALAADGALLVTGGGDAGSSPSLDVIEPAPRPDGRIRKGTTGAYRGNDIYNLTGVGQTVGGSAVRGATVTYFVSVQNDGRAATALRLRGTASTTRFRVKYTANGVGISNGVVNSTYLTPTLAPGATFTVKVQVTVLAAAPAGASLTAQLRASDPAVERFDVVKFTTRRA